MSKSYHRFNKRISTIKEFVHVTSNETSPKPLEVEVIVYACILEKIKLEKHIGV